MGKIYTQIEPALSAWISAQPLFFVATAPRAGGHVNLSPKGPIDSLRVVDPHTVEYEDHVGSGVETIAHLRDDGRICIMLCAFSGSPRIVRLHGRGVFLPALDTASGTRGVVRVAVDRVSDSCGYGVPLMELIGQRPQRQQWLERKGEDGVRAYVKEKNAVSIDGLPAVDTE